MRPAVIVVVGALLAACGRARTAPGRARDAGATTTGADAPPARGGPDDPMAEKLRHCPTTVPGSVTVLSDVPGGIDVTVTAIAPDVMAEVQRRAAHLVELSAGRAARGEHGGGAGGGFMQNCPVVIRSTSITTADLPDGVRLEVRPRGSLTVDELRADTRRRQAALAGP